jgi:hypothetical protein
VKDADAVGAGSVVKSFVDYIMILTEKKLMRKHITILAVKQKTDSQRKTIARVVTIVTAISDGNLIKNDQPGCRSQYLSVYCYVTAECSNQMS